jgi:hypothetical protein
MKFSHLLLLFFCNAVFAIEYPPPFETWHQADVSLVYRQFTYVPVGIDAAFSSGKIDSIVALKKGAKPKYVLINMPGGDGDVHLELTEDKKIKSFWGWNTFIRMQKLFAANDYYVVTLNATNNTNKVRAIVKTLTAEFNGIPIYIVGISKSTRNTISLAKDMDGEVAGFIHASTVADAVHSFNTGELTSRNVFIHNKGDACKGTPFSSVQYSSERYGTRLIVLEGGDDKDLYACGPFTLHGFYQIENNLYKSLNDWVEDK